MSKEFIKKKLRELLKESHLGNQMKPVFNGNITPNGNFHNTLIIAEDNDNPNQHYLILNVKLLPNVNHYDYSYGFSIYDENLKKSYGYFYNRDDVKKWLPKEWNNRVIPKIIEMTKDLVLKNKPHKITRKAMENLEGNSLIRYQKITDTLIDLGYKLQEGYPKKDAMGKLEWIFIDDNNKNHNLNEETILEYDFFDHERRLKWLNETSDAVLTPEEIRKTINNRTK